MFVTAVKIRLTAPLSLGAAKSYILYYFVCMYVSIYVCMYVSIYVCSISMVIKEKVVTSVVLVSSLVSFRIFFPFARHAGGKPSVVDSR